MLAVQEVAEITWLVVFRANTWKSIAGGTNAAVQAEGNHLQNRGLIAEDDTSTRYYRESTTLNHLLGAKYLHILL